MNHNIEKGDYLSIYIGLERKTYDLNSHKEPKQH